MEGLSMPWAVIVPILCIIISSLASLFVASRRAQSKIQQERLRYAQKQTQQFIKNARAHLNDVYLPINAALSKLILSEKAREKFKEGFKSYQSVISLIRQKGDDAFIFDELDDLLDEFNKFLESSIPAQKTKRGLSVEYRSPPIRIGPEEIFIQIFPFGGLWPFLKQELYVKTTTYAAPLRSKAFEEKFNYYTKQIKRRIREITLGTPGEEINSS